MPFPKLENRKGAEICNFPFVGTSFCVDIPSFMYLRCAYVSVFIRSMICAIIMQCN